MAVDVTPRGVAAVRSVLQRNWDEIKLSSLDLVRKHFEANPSDIPRPEHVKHDLLASAASAWDEEPP
jgi:hypothetical protein